MNIMDQGMELNRMEVREYDEMEWRMIYLTLDQTLTILLIWFDFEKHLTLNQECFYSFEKYSFYRFDFILAINM